MIRECNCSNIINSSPINSAIIELYSYSIERGQTTAIFKDPTNKIAGNILCDDSRLLDPLHCKQFGYIVVPNVKICDDCPQVPLVTCPDEEEVENAGKRVTEIWLITSASHDVKKQATTVTFQRLSGRRIAGDCRLDRNDMGGSKYQHFQDELFLYNPTDNPYAFSDVTECLHHLREEARCVVMYQSDLNNKNEFFYGERCLVIDSMHNGCLRPKMFFYNPEFPLEGNPYALHWQPVEGDCNIATEDNIHLITTPLKGDRVLVNTCTGYREYYYDPAKGDNIVNTVNLGKFYPIDKTSCFINNPDNVSLNNPKFSYNGDTLYTCRCTSGCDGNVGARQYVWDDNYNNKFINLSHWRPVSNVACILTDKGQVNANNPKYAYDGDQLYIGGSCPAVTRHFVYDSNYNNADGNFTHWREAISPVVWSGSVWESPEFTIDAGFDFAANPWDRSVHSYISSFPASQAPRSLPNGYKWLVLVIISGNHWLYNSSLPSGAVNMAQWLRFGIRSRGQIDDSIEQTHNYPYCSHCDGDITLSSLYDIGSSESFNGQIELEWHSGGEPPAAAQFDIPADKQGTQVHMGAYMKLIWMMSPTCQE
jgi:hypothetical protein